MGDAFILRAVSEFGTQDTFYHANSIEDAINMARIWMGGDGPWPVSLSNANGAIVMDEAEILRAADSLKEQE